MQDSVAPHDAIDRAAAQLGWNVRFVDRYDLGAEGAYRVTVGGRICAFKYWSGERAAALRLDRAVVAHTLLRQHHWPLPTIYRWHQERSFAFVVEEHLHGHRVDAVSEAVYRHLLLLLDAAPERRDDATDESAAWVASLEQALHRDGTFPGRLSDVERSEPGRRLVAQARRAFTRARSDLVAGRHVLHGDFSAGNILCDDAEEVTAVLDWQHGGIGHRGYDLVNLEWDAALRLNVGSAPSLAVVTARVNAEIAEPVRAFCRLYYAVWNLSWALDTPAEEDVLHAAAVLGIM